MLIWFGSYCLFSQLPPEVDSSTYKVENVVQRILLTALLPWRRVAVDVPSVVRSLIGIDMSVNRRKSVRMNSR